MLVADLDNAARTDTPFSRSRAPLLVAFALSGSASLILEVVWFRLLGMQTGVVASSAGLVTAAYMGGLAAGNWLGSRVADHASRRLWIYAAMELLVALSACVMPFVLIPIASFSAGTQWLIAGVVMLIPTTAMGMGLPLLAASIESTSAHTGRATALLCGINTAGAAAGVAWVGFVAELSPERISLIAAAVQILVVGLVLSVARQNVVHDSPVETPSAEGVRPQRVALIGAGCASAAAMLVQVSWTELLHQRFGTLGPGFSMTLLAFIGGLSLGGFLATRLLARDDDPGRMLVFMLALTAGSLALATLIGRTWMPGADTSALIAALPLLPMTIAGGSLFPLFIAMSARRGTAIGRSVGSTGAASTAGAIAGSLGAMVLLPLAGVGLSLFGCLAVYSGLSVLFAVKAR